MFVRAVEPAGHFLLDGDTGVKMFIADRVKFGLICYNFNESRNDGTHLWPI